MKVAVIGGGSTYTPELVEGFGLRRDVLPVDELVLHDIDRERLDIVGGLAGRILEKLEFPGRLTLTTYGNLWQFPAADTLLIELTNVDSPYISPSKVPSVTTLSGVQAVIPAR